MDEPEFEDAELIEEWVPIRKQHDAVMLTLNNIKRVVVWCGARPMWNNKDPNKTRIMIPALDGQIIYAFMGDTIAKDISTGRFHVWKTDEWRVFHQPTRLENSSERV